MTGSVLSLHALLPVMIRVPNVPNVTVEFVVDTGFTGYLTLPTAAVNAMGLPYYQDVDAYLADDSHIPIAVHSANILWNGTEIEVPVLATGRRPLLGTAMLDGCELRAQFIEEGGLTVQEITAPS